jgi:hypothetical protein
MNPLAFAPVDDLVIPSPPIWTDSELGLTFFTKAPTHNLIALPLDTSPTTSSIELPLGSDE